jgi:LysM repeat protein
MKLSTIQRFVSGLAVLVMLVTALMHASPVAAQSNGTAPYTVRSGETLKEIADKYGLTVEKILAANKNITDPNLIHTGQVIILPVGRSEGVSAAEKAKRIFVWQREKDGGRVESSEHLYLVRSGDNFTRIAKAFGVTEERLQAVNPQIDDLNQLFRGELIYIPEGRAEITPKFYSTPLVPSK